MGDPCVSVGYTDDGGVCSCCQYALSTGRGRYLSVTALETWHVATTDQRPPPLRHPLQLVSFGAENLAHLVQIPSAYSQETAAISGMRDLRRQY